MAAQPKNTPKKVRIAKQKLDSNDVDVEHIAAALGRIRNPATRYFLSMMIDALTEDLAQIEFRSSAHSLDAYAYELNLPVVAEGENTPV